MATLAPGAPIEDMEYELVLGDSLLDDGGSDSGDAFLTLRFDFKPASAADATHGLLEVHQGNHVRIAQKIDLKLTPLHPLPDA